MVIRQLTCKKIIKDLIKINSIASLIFSIFNIIQIISILLNPSLVETTINAIVEQNQNNINTIFNKQQITTLFYTVSGVIAIFSFVLISHIVIGFKLIKTYTDSFLTE